MLCFNKMRRPKNVKFDTKVASSTRMMYALRFLKKRFLIAAKFAKSTARLCRWRRLGNTRSPEDTRDGSHLTCKKIQN